MKKTFQIVALAGAVIFILGLAVALVQSQFGALVMVHLVAGGALLLAGFAANLREAKEFLAARSLRMGPQVFLQALLLLLIIFFVNYLALRNDWVKDVTAIKLYTLRPQTISTMNGLPGSVEVKAFFPGGGSTEPRERLKLYQTRFSSKVDLKFVDPDKNEDEARLEAVPPRPGALFKYQGKSAWIEKYEEQDITNAFIKVTRSTAPLVWFTQNHGEPTLSAEGPNGLSTLAKVLEEQGYKLETIDLQQVDKIPAEVSMIALVGLTMSLANHERDLIDAYLAQGGNALITIDPAWEPAQVSGLETFVTPYFLKVKNNVIRDEVHRLAEDKTGLWLVTKKLAANHVITQDLTRPNLVFYWARALETTAATSPDFVIEPLVFSEDESFEKRIDPHYHSTLASDQARSDYIRDILQQGPVPPEQKGPFVLAYAVRRMQDHRQWLGDQRADEMRMVVIGSSSLFRNLSISMPYNWEFTVNCFNWLAGEKDLKIISPPKRGGSRLTLEKNQKNWILYISVMILPEAFMIVGLAIWWRKR